MTAPAFERQLPSIAHVGLADAIAYALFDVWTEADEVCLLQLQANAGPHGLLTGLTGQAREDKEADFLEALRRAAARGLVMMIGRRASELGEREPSEFSMLVESVPALYFRNPVLFDEEADRISYDIQAIDNREELMRREAHAGGGSGLVEWEGVAVERASFLAWLAILRPVAPPPQSADTRAAAELQQPKPSKPRPFTGKDYRASDATFFDEMTALLREGVVSSVRDAAGYIVEKHGTLVRGVISANPESKIVRLASRYREANPKYRDLYRDR